MNLLDQVSLVLHVLAAVGLIAGGVVQLMTGTRLRTAENHESIERWAVFARSAGPLLIGSAIVSLATGGHLAGSVWTSDTISGFSYPFITLGAAALVLLAPVGPMLGGARLRRLVDDARSGGDLGELRSRVGDPMLWGPVHSLVGVGVGLVWVMSAKPESWVVTGAILLGTFLIGWGTGTAVAGTRRVT